MPDPAVLRPVAAAATRPLRRAVLRPDQPPEACVYPGDDAPETVHLGAFVAGALVGVASLYAEEPPRAWAPPPGGAEAERTAVSDRGSAWRLRGMAVEPAHRGRGLGAALLAACVSHARAASGRVLWCNARASAAGFYERAGFAPEGAEFELDGIGLHRVWRLRV